MRVLASSGPAHAGSPVSRRTERVALRSSPCRARHGAARRSAHGARAAGRARTRASSPPAGRGPRRPATRRWRRPCPGRTSTPRSLRRRARRPSWRGPSVAHRSHTRSRSIVRRRCKGRRHAGASCDRPFRRRATPAPPNTRQIVESISTTGGFVRSGRAPAAHARRSASVFTSAGDNYSRLRPLSEVRQRLRRLVHGFAMVDARRIVTAAKMDTLTLQERPTRTTRAKSVSGTSCRRRAGTSV